MRASAWLLSLVVGVAGGSDLFAEWAPKRAPLMTRWAGDVAPETVHPEYPRPQLVRPAWLNLNGLWQYSLAPVAEQTPPITWEGEILVPFAIESALSGVMKPVAPGQALWYRRTFTVPTDAAWTGQEVLLQFGAVDWETTVWVNGREVGQHRGGYDPFSFDITAALRPEPNATQELVIKVVDNTDDGYQPRGKQVRKPNGIWYTSVTGIWQTVWLEPVPKSHVRSAVVTPDIDRDTASLWVDYAGEDVTHIAVRTSYSQGDVRHAATFTLPAMNRQPLEMDRSPEYRKVLWSPATPRLIDMELKLLDKQGRVLDVVQTYFAHRKISLGKDERGILRIMLNNEPLFQYGTLDQGWWPDGLYTAPTDAALKSDIEQTKRYGFNMIRKHVKVEPARWYRYCDELGMLVWQDMPNGDRHAAWDPFGGHDGTEISRTAESAANYRTEWQRIIDALRPHPSIVMWVPFNEAWGQADTVAVTKWTKEYDPSRLVNCASGGNDFPVGDVIDVHRYPGPTMVAPSDTRAGVLGEYGGLGLPLKGHTWQDEQNWGYRSFTTQEALTDAYLDLADQLPALVRQGLSAAIYTQTTDVEIEVNGLMTYDRAIEKLPVEALATAHQALWSPRETVRRTLVPTAEETPATWRYVTEAPAEGWEQPEFDAAIWREGRGGFGEPSTPGSNVGTEWKTPDIWARRAFTLDKLPEGALRLRIHHDEEATVYLNGVLIKQTGGYTTEYKSLRLSDVAREALRVGTNVLAVHCHQTGGGQSIDVGLEVETVK